MSYAQSGEDEMILALAAKLPGIPDSFVDIGAGDGERWSNTRLLAERGWMGEWFDASQANVDKALKMRPNEGVGVHCERITCERLPTVLPCFPGVLSIDIDGNDYWVWKALHNVIRPWIVVIEAQFQPGTMNRDPWKDEWVQPYDPDWVWPDLGPPHETYDWGATPAALIALGKELGYTYVGKPDDPHNPNLFFVRSDVCKVRAIS